MTRRTLLPEAVERYVSETITKVTPLQANLRDETAKLPEAEMQIGADQGAFFSLLMRLMNAKRVIEVGSFTGYSALALASGLPEEGRLIACDVSKEFTDVARRYWDKAGLSKRIDLRIGAADKTLQTLIDDGQSGTFDFAFIDADKTGYDRYYELCLTLLRRNGVVALDNMLWNGSVADPNVHDKDTDALRALNRKIRDDSRVESCLLTVGDGIMLARKRGE